MLYDTKVNSSTLFFPFYCSFVILFIKMFKGSQTSYLVSLVRFSSISLLFLLPIKSLENFKNIYKLDIKEMVC